jgi:hypothetical protein
MEKLFQKLLEAEILTEDVKKELQTAYSEQLNEAVAAAKKEANEQVRIELTEQWVTERNTLIEAIDAQVGEFLKEELDELKSDVHRFRDLEAEYAEKLVEAKKDMAKSLEGDMNELVDKIDAFLEIRLNAEMEELKEDIKEVKKLEFGRKLFEGFTQEYRKNFVDASGVEKELRETRQQAARLAKKLQVSEQKLDEQVRGAKMTDLLKPLAGKQREVMETLLLKLPTENLEEGYKAFIGRVIKSDTGKDKEKENKVLAESTKPVKLDESKTKLITGDSDKKPKDTKLDESVKTGISEWKRLAGIE